ncbi:phospholipase C/P1 nuclease domain-containing protein [Bombardia bombarda]|uniref:Phospholipase C/P1 nuclease domain-containing protein n=1 Tax=Bombardia bombarda TaxID=252184 RepID=A0AA39X771_9PEZI|nr:phospholipase C/P1 nuclease domain-containing protein [Bombardia bombarda]
MKLSSLAVGAAVLPGTAWAWGAAYFQALLRNDTQDYLAGVATWADSLRYTKWGRFTGPFHYIDAKDSPPSYCGIDYERDCKQEGCVVSAIQNYTGQLLDPQLPYWDRVKAAKFVIHFVGDIHQPLHTEDVAKGGNGIHVTFDHVNFNLHHVWDTSIAEKLVGGRVRRQPYPAARQFADRLTEEIRLGKFNVSREGWLGDVELADPVATALAWAREGNAYVCSTVLPEGAEAISGQELGGEYYDKAAPVVEVQIAKAGYRLAAWLDLIASSINARETLKESLKESSMGDL